MKIKFHQVRELPEPIEKPYPGSRNLPDWFKNLSNKTTGDFKTVKKCPPFLDAMSTGYIIPVPMDLIIAIDEKGEDWVLFPKKGDKEKYGKYTIVESHDASQYPGTPFANMPVRKLYTPWIIETEPGYSLLFLPPINRFDLPCVPISGLVECDNYFNTVNFPCVFPTLRPGYEVRLNKGDPLVQVVPIKRDTWDAKHTFLDDDILNRAHEYRENMAADRDDFYKRKAWEKKNFK